MLRFFCLIINIAPARVPQSTLKTTTLDQTMQELLSLCIFTEVKEGKRDEQDETGPYLPRFQTI